MEFVDYRVEEHIAHVVMNRGPVNALSTELVRDILEAYKLAKEDPDVRCVMLESALPKVFGAGMDLDMHLAQYRMAKPTIAVVNGAARAA